jgi:hypothetical protein
MARLLSTGVVLLLALGIMGCTGQAATLKGTLQKEGKSYTFADNEEVDVQLVGTDIEGKPYSTGTTVSREDGSFTLTGPTGRGIPPGNYKITLLSRQFSSAPKGPDDGFHHQFSADKTPLTYTVTTEPAQEIVVDVGKKSVTRK